MSCGGRHFCPGCGQELIHRDNRKPWESASAFGQIIWRTGPVRITCGDIDFYVWKSLPGGELLRLVEHKQPSSPLKEMQSKVLLLLDSIVRHAAACPEFSDYTLDPRSGVYVIRGLIQADPDGRRATNFHGSQIVSKAVAGTFERVNGRFAPGQARLLETPEHVFRFLEGTTPDRAGGPRRDEQLPPPAGEHQDAA